VTGVQTCALPILQTQQKEINDLKAELRRARQRREK
jgi:hypothetical protein